MASKRAPMRYPIHTGTRVTATDEVNGFCLAAIPLFKGEKLTKLRLNALVVTRTAEANVDQPPIFSWFGAFFPRPMFSPATSVALSTSTLDALVESIDANSPSRLGGDESVANIDHWLGQEDIGGVDVFFRRHRLGIPVPVGLDGLGNADARFIDQFDSSVDRGIVAKETGLILFGFKQYDVSADTNFGVADLDTLAPHLFADIYQQRGLADVGGSVEPSAETIFGGDNYIEADSIKGTASRYYVIASASIRMSDVVAQTR